MDLLAHLRLNIFIYRKASYSRGIHCENVPRITNPRIQIGIL